MNKDVKRLIMRYQPFENTDIHGHLIVDIKSWDKTTNYRMSIVYKNFKI